MKNKLKYIFTFFIATLFCSNTNAQTTILTQNFEGAFTVIGANSGGFSTISDGAPVNTPSGGQSWYGNGNGFANDVWHKSNSSAGWSSSSDICGGADPPPSCGANGTSFSALFDGYDAGSGTWGYIYSPPIDLSPYASCGGPVTLTFYYLNYDESQLVVQFWNGSAWVTAATFGTTAYAWTLETVTVPASCLINGTYLLFNAQSSFNFYPIGIDEVKLVGTSCCTPPTTQAANFSSSVVCGVSETINWTRGNGNDVMVVCRAGSATTGPTSGTGYTANTVYGSGTACGGGYCVYNGTGTSVTVTGLTAGTTYYYDIYEYNTAGTCYKTPSLSGSVLMSTNDNWACASTLTVGGGAVAGTTSGASLEANESVACNSTAAGQTYTVDQSVWYKFVASATTNWVQITWLTGCKTTFGAVAWDPTIVAQNGSTYQTTNNNGAYCGMMSCQGMLNNNAASNPFLFELCNLTVGNTYYMQIVNSNSGCGGPSTFNIGVTAANPGGTITNPCHQAGAPANSLSAPVAECYINACATAPGCPACTTYSLNGGTGLNQNNIVWNDYYSFTTAGGCSNDLEFQQCVVASVGGCSAGNVSWLSYQLYNTSGGCITSGDFSTSTDAYGYLGIPGVGCSTSYILQYTTEQINCTYWSYTPFTDNYGSSTCVLPITLIRFTANENDQGMIDLDWATASETDENYYTLERSTDAKNFTKFAKVKGAGTTTSKTTYAVTDTVIVEENTVYYRLSQTDMNGATNTFNVIEVNKTRNFSVSVYPNPSTGNFNLDFSSAAGNFIMVELMNAGGKTLSSKLYMGSGGMQHHTIEDLDAGVYFLTLKINGQVIHKKLVKL
jgi:hypothetical protein